MIFSKKLFVIALFHISVVGFAQDATVEKSVFNVQAGAFGAWINNEWGLSKEIALRTEFGLDMGIISDFASGSNVFLAPVFTLEPRWYYNLEKRAAKSRKTANNTGNFLSLKTSYNPDSFVIGSVDNVRVQHQIFIIPTWGIRRHIGQHFNYEAGIGLGYHQVLSKVRYSDDSGPALNLHLRIGYTK